MTSNSPGSSLAANPFNPRPLNLEAAAFLTIFLGLVYLFARNFPASPSPRRPKEDIEEGFRTQRTTEFLISEGQRF